MIFWFVWLIAGWLFWGFELQASLLWLFVVGCFGVLIADSVVYCDLGWLMWFGLGFVCLRFCLIVLLS